MRNLDDIKFHGLLNACIHLREMEEQNIRVSTHEITGRRFSEYKHSEIFNGDKVHYYDWAMFDSSNQKIATFTLYTYDDDQTTAYFSDFLVKEDMRGNGIGRFVLKNIDSFAPNKKCDRIYLWVQKSKSKKALPSDILIPWYERHGFEQVPESEEEDCVWMVKQISNIPKNQKQTNI